MSVSNPFETAEAWNTSTERYLGIGNHEVTIKEVDDTTTASSGNPKLVLLFENANGSIKHFEPYHCGHLAHLVELFDKAGIERPKEGEFDPEDNCRLNAAGRARLLNRRVGIVVREEPDYQDPSKKWPRVQGYYEPAQGHSDIPADTAGLPDVGAGHASTYTASDDDIPF